MNFQELITKRQSVRKYSSKEVDKKLLNKCIEAVRIAPSASNSQPWKLIIVDDKNLSKEVANATFSKTVSFNKFATQAPVMAVFVLEKPRLITQVGAFLKKRDFPLIDIGIAAEHFCLQATELGLGTCMLGWFNQKKIQEILKIPKSKNIGLVVTLGYPDDVQRAKTRKVVDVMSSYNEY